MQKDKVRGLFYYCTLLNNLPSKQLLVACKVAGTISGPEDTTESSPDSSCPQAACDKCTIKHREEGFSVQVTFEQRSAEEGTSHTDKRKEPQAWAKGTIGANA